jgi:hypothetical protein
VTLRWSVADAVIVNIDNSVGRVGMDGTVTVAPQKTTKFTLTAAGEENNCYVPSFGFKYNNDMSQMVSRVAWRGSSSVTFLFGIQDEKGSVNWWPALPAAYDGKFNSLDIDLSSYGGRKVMAILRVEAGADAQKDLAIWIEPKISR